jgi:hypothetical protein
MSKVNKFVLGIACCLVLAIPAVAQMGMHGGPPQFRGIWNPVVGSGGAYEMQGKDGQKSNMEIAIVGKESVAGKDGYWFEMTMANPRMNGVMVMKSLTVLDGENVVVSRMIMQMPGAAPMEMPTQMMQMHHQPQTADIRKEAEDVGSESVTTPAGTFTCEHYRLKDGTGDSWVSEKAAPYGLVKFQGKDSSMVLTKIIADAKDKITGTPQQFNPMGMMQHPPEQ